MMEIVKPLLIYLVVPAVGLLVFRWLKDDMYEKEIEDPPIAPFFMIFATYGGWLIVILTLIFWHWSGMALLGVMYLMFLAPVTMIVLAVWLYPKRGLSPYHYGAFILSAGYLIIPIAVMVARVSG
jgi:hypothetical protein